MAEEKEVTIYDIARTLNISAATVSRGLQNSPAISDATKKRILETAETMGYRFNTFARNLRSKKTYSIGVIVPRLNSVFMSDVIAGIESVANQEGYSVIISQSLEEEKKEAKNAKLLFHNRVDGLIVSLAANTRSAAHFQPYFKKKIPLVFFDRVFQQYDSPTIVIDNYRAAYELTQHLIDTGKRRILHIAGNLLRNVYADRFRGYKEALLANGIPFTEDLLIECNLSAAEGTEIAQRITEMPQRPDAVFAANDTCAVHCMQTLKATGLHIPEDIAIAGFNDDPLCMIAEPHITSIKYQGYQMGIIAAQTLIDNLNKKIKANLTQSIILKHELLIRGSSIGVEGRSAPGATA